MKTKLLRQKILDLAIRGKLTEQKKSDGTTAELLAQMSFPAPTGNLAASSNKKKGKSAEPKQIIPLDKSEAPFEIPENWEWVRLGDVGKTITGATPSKTNSAYEGCDIPFLSPGDVSLNNEIISYDKQGLSELGKTVARPVVKNSVIQVCIGGSIGKCAIVDREVCFNQQINSITVDGNVEYKYVFLVLQSAYFQSIIRLNATGTATPIINKSSWDALTIPLPPHAEQQRIVTAIENAFAEITEIENNQELLKKHIKQGRQKILDLAIRGKLTQQLKTDGTTKDLLKQIQDERAVASCTSSCHCEAQKRRGNLNQSKSAPSKQIIPLNKSETPFEIPSTWEWVKLGDICDISSAKRVLQEDWKDSGIPFYRAREIAQLANGEKVKDDLFITKELYQSLKAKYGVPQSEDILMSAVGTIGKTYIVKETDQFYYKDASVICLKKKSSQILAKFLKVLLASDFLQKQMYANSSGTTVDTITISVAQEYVLPLPPLAEQQRIVATIEQAFAEFDAMEVGLM